MILEGAGLAELHTHLGGSVASEILWSIAHEQGIALPVKDFWEFDALGEPGEEDERVDEPDRRDPHPDEDRAGKQVADAPGVVGEQEPRQHEPHRRDDDAVGERVGGDVEREVECAANRRRRGADGDEPDQPDAEEERRARRARRLRDRQAPRERGHGAE